jgi:dolichol-phosphate mannosyltransferase
MTAPREQRVVIVVPAYNEAANLPTLLENTARRMQALGRPFHIIIVDDGSRDGTPDVVRSHAASMPVEVVSHATNRGVAAVFRTGFERALEIAGPDDIIVTKEADNTSDPAILDRMLSGIDGGKDVMLASCFAAGGAVVGSTLDRHILSFCANLLLRTFLPLRGVHTYSSFYRAYRADVLRRAFVAYGGGLIECQGFACLVEVLVKLGRLPIAIGEVPMVLQAKLRKGPSKMVRMVQLRTIAEYLTLIRRQAFRSRRAERSIRFAFESAQEARVERA